MTGNVENLVLEHLKAIQAEQAASRERDREVVVRLGQIEAMIARIGRDNAYAYEEQITDRHTMDALKERVGRIERRLEIEG